MIDPKRKRLFITVSYLFWAAMFYRWYAADLAPTWEANRGVVIPIAVYGLLLGLDTWITRRVGWRAVLYLAVQSGLISIAAMQAAELDFFYLLLLPLVGQAVFLLPRRPAYVVVGALAAVDIAGLIVMVGWPEAISYMVIYNGAIVFTLGYSVLMLEADASRRETKRLLTELQEYAETTRQLAVVEERNRLARELHDSVTQALYGMTLQSEAMARKAEHDSGSLAAEEIRELRDIAQQALREMRLMIFELRPTILKEEGLAAALQSRLETVENRSGFHTSLENELEKRLPRDVETGLYGIAREALNNISKHAQAKQIDIKLGPGRGDSVLFEIRDDGVGFDAGGAAANGGLGLKGMRERAEQMGATLTITSRAAEGTCIRVEVPG